MSLKQTLYRRQLNFVRILIGFAISVYFLLFNQQLIDKLPAMVRIGILVVFGLYAAFKTFMGVAFLMTSRQDAGKCFFGLLKTDTPKHPLNTPAERYATLAQGFYEAKEVLRNYKDELAGLAKDPDFRPEKPQKYGSQLFLNALEGMHDLSEDGRLKSPLEVSWDVTDNESALQTVSGLWESALSKQESPVRELADYALYDECIADFGLKFADADKQTNASGFDIVRTVWMARASFTLGYIDEKTTRDILDNAAAFIAANFQTWEQLAYSYLMTFIAWTAANTDEMGYDYVRERITAVQQYLKDPNSPLKGTSLDELRRALAQPAA